ncbi:M56 family metallopeptidase [Tessaracoccus caeni]|uniref:M56 family metallopeptidase n=1 Tax=Tessaracoccus caeni TaxID=3031239 RepID=UPI0023D9C4BC|nr:M56 family metallopeptidase [Tessaracoccus caeni]MDF1489839.1 M56 family metallopeptidase [Tessaracoccus caeni]
MTLLATTLIIALWTPTVLCRGSWQVFHPRLALGLWFTVLGLGLASSFGLFLATLAIAATTTTSSTSGLLISVGAWLTVFVTAGAIAVLGAVAEPLADSYKASLSHLHPVATSRQDRGAFILVRFASEQPVAVAVPGRDPEILISSSLEASLTRPQLRIVLAHEYAHLRGHHGLLVRAAELSAAFLPRFLPAGQQLRRATLMLVELIADDSAARQAGSEQVAITLARLAELSGDAGYLLRAQRLRQAPGATSPIKGLALPVRV